MSTNCDRCGYRDNEVKSGSAISDRGKKITLKIEDREDLSRDILKVRSIIEGNSNLLTLSPERNKRTDDTRNRPRSTTWNAWWSLHDS